MTPSRASVGLSVPSLTLSPTSSSLTPALIDAEWRDAEVEAVTAQEREDGREVEVVDSNDEEDSEDDGGGWQTVNPLAEATQFEFNDSQLPSYGEEEEDEEEMEEPSPPVPPAATITRPPHPQQPPHSQNEEAVMRSTPALPSSSHFPSLPSNLPSGPLPLCSTSPSPPSESAPPAAVVPPPNPPEPVEPPSPPRLPDEDVPYVADSPVFNSPDIAASLSSQPSLASQPQSPSARPSTPPRPPSPPRQSSSQSSAVELSPPPHASPLELSPPPFGHPSLHPSLPALEPGTMEEEGEEERIRAVDVMDIELDDSPLYNSDRPPDTGASVREGESIAAQRDTPATRSSASLPSSLGKRRAGAMSAIPSPPPPPPPPTARPTVTFRPPSPVTASQLLTDSQYPIPLDEDLPGAEAQRPQSPPTPPPQSDEDGEEEGEDDEEDNPSVLSHHSPPRAAPGDTHPSSCHSVMEVELDSDVDDNTHGDEAGEGEVIAELAVAAVSGVKDEQGEEVEEEVGDSLDGAFNLRSLLSGSRPGSSPVLLSPTFTVSPSSPEIRSPSPPPRPTRRPSPPPRPPREEKQGEDVQVEPPSIPRTRSGPQDTPNRSSRGQRERKRKSGAVRVEQADVGSADENEGLRMADRRKRGKAKEVGGRKPRNSQRQSAPHSSPTRRDRDAGSGERKSGNEERGEEDERRGEVDSIVDDDDVFVRPVGRSGASTAAQAAVLSSPLNDLPLTPTTAKLTARERSQRRAAVPQQKPPTSHQPARKDSEDAEVRDSSRGSKRRKKSGGETAASTSAPSGASSTQGRSAGKGSDGRLKQTSLTDFSFSSASSGPLSEEDLFVRPVRLSSSSRPVPPLRRSSTRRPLSDVSNTVGVSSPSKGRSKEGEGTPWQLKKKKSGLLSLRDEAPSIPDAFDQNGGSPVRATRATASAGATASALKGRRRVKLPLTSRAPSSATAVEASKDPFRFVGEEVNLLSSQE